MGKPKKCDFRPDPFIQYTTTTTSTTTPQPEDFSNYIHIPVSGLACPTTTTTTTTTTSTTPPPFDPNFPCVSYSFLPNDSNGAVLTFAPCQNNKSLNQVVVGSTQRLDFCAERTSQIKILSGNGRLVYNGGCNQFENDIKTTTTTTTTTTTPNPLVLIPPASLYYSINENEICSELSGSWLGQIESDVIFYTHRIWFFGDSSWSNYALNQNVTNIVIEQGGYFHSNIPSTSFYEIANFRLYDYSNNFSYYECCSIYTCPPAYPYYQFRAKLTRPGSIDSEYRYSEVGFKQAVRF